MLYEAVCKENQLAELIGRNVKITFSQTTSNPIDKSVWTKERSTITVSIKTKSKLPESSVGTFAIRNCLEILNKVVSSYQATTHEVDNAGFIMPLGTSDMQLFAEIQVNGQDFRDRWPSYSFNTSPLLSDQVEEFKRYLSGQEQLPLSKLFLVSAILSLERGQYSLAVLQAAMAVELRLTQVVRTRLIARGWPDEAIEPYEKLTLGQKLRIPKKDPRSLKFHLGKVAGFSELFKKLENELTPLRNDVTHRGHLASHKEAKQAVEMVREFLRMVS